ncbi:hypothetical protein EDD90_10957 [Streptomyces sp. Ag109_O5-1]|nr:hypothetical protein EDD90_10957 [Streptomyces sp. Ag109_O5-1]
MSWYYCGNSPAVIPRDHCGTSFTPTGEPTPKRPSDSARRPDGSCGPPAFGSGSVTVPSRPQPRSPTSSPG